VKGLAGGLLLCLPWVLLWSGAVAARVFTIGMITNTAIHDAAIAGFKEGMAELGYVEGENVRYLYNGISDTDEKIDAALGELLAQEVDLLLSAGKAVTTRLKAALEGTDMPILMTAALRPVEDGLVVSLVHPGGSVTGVRVIDTSVKTLEWLRKVSEEITKGYVPFNPDDGISRRTLDELYEMAPQIGIGLVLGEMGSVEEATDAIARLPEDIDAILRIPSPTFDMRNSELSQAAIRRKIPMAASLPLEGEVVLMCTTSMFGAGKQNARLAHLILRGEKPGELPVETAEPELTINLKAAEEIGVFIPDEILVQASTIIRQ